MMICVMKGSVRPTLKKMVLPLQQICVSGSGLVLLQVQDKLTIVEEAGRRKSAGDRLDENKAH